MEIIYRVKAQDKLCDIAKFFNTTIEQIVFDNNLNCKIKENQSLIIELNRGKVYVVKPFCCKEKVKKLIANYKVNKGINLIYPFQKIKFYY